MAPRIGEILSTMFRLSPLDIEEILQEQNVSTGRFGQIALSLGLCSPEDVWAAWYRQLTFGARRIDLEELGVDTQAVDQVPGDVARQYDILPVRTLGDQLVAAIAFEAAEPPTGELENRLRKQVRFVRADSQQVRNAIDRHYPLCSDAPLN